MQSTLQSPSRLADLIGTRIRSLRTARGMSVNSLAAAAGVSAGIVSQIERDKANPSLSTIEKICDALGVRTDAVLTAETVAADPPFVCRVDRRSHIQVGDAPLLKEMISPPGDRSLRLMIISLPPRSENLDVVMRPGQKAGLVMEGEIRVVVGDRSAQLYPGDAFQFASTLPHSLHNDSGAPAKVLWVIAESLADGAF